MTSSRILRLVCPCHSEDFFVVYLHRNAKGLSAINGSPGKIVLLPPGNPLTAEGDDLHVILSCFPQMEEGVFLKPEDDEEECFLRVVQCSPASCEVEILRSGFLTLSQKLSPLRPLSVGVLTISDKGSRGERIDTAGPALEELILDIGGIVRQRGIVPDEQDIIAGTIKQWVDEDDCHLVLTTGGTGLAARDVTPEALLSVASRVVPGIGEAMRALTWQNAPRAILTRGLAVARGESLIVSFPGSERGVRECFGAVAPVLRHAVEILRNWEKDCGAHKHHHSHS
jgi:molybdenum cofactor synthesis domain-containing protein